MMIGKEPSLDLASKSREDAVGGWPYKSKVKCDSFTRILRVSGAITRTNLSMGQRK